MTGRRGARLESTLPGAVRWTPSPPLACRGRPTRSGPRCMARFDRHFGRLGRLLEEVYGPGEATTRELALLAGQLATSWQERPADLHALDAAREADPTWFTSQRMLGGVLYVDRYAGDLAGVRRQIPYFEELGLTYLHLMPLFEAPQENSDGGYAVSSYREVDPSLGTMDGAGGPGDRAARARDRARRRLHLQPHVRRARVGPCSARRGPRARGLLLDLPRPDHAGRVRAHGAGDLPRRPPRLVRAGPDARRAR